MVACWALPHVPLPHVRRRPLRRVRSTTRAGGKGRGAPPPLSTVSWRIASTAGVSDGGGLAGENGTRTGWTLEFVLPVVSLDPRLYMSPFCNTTHQCTMLHISQQVLASRHLAFNARCASHPRRNSARGRAGCKQQVSSIKSFKYRHVLLSEERAMYPISGLANSNAKDASEAQNVHSTDT